MGTTPDHLPHIGRVPGAKNHCILAGFNGGGMAQIFLAAKGVAKMVVEEVEYTESGLPGIFETSVGRLRRVK